MGDSEMYGNDEYHGPERRVHDCKQGKAISKLQRDVTEVKGDVKSVVEKVDGLRSSSYGPNGTGGTVGKVNTLQGAFRVVVVLLVLMVSSSVGFGLWNVTLASRHLKAIAALQTNFNVHSEKPTHAPEEDLDAIHDRMHERNGG